jgi:hypothetical protein
MKKSSYMAKLAGAFLQLFTVNIPKRLDIAIST